MCRHWSSTESIQTFNAAPLSLHLPLGTHCKQLIVANLWQTNQDQTDSGGKHIKMLVAARGTGKALEAATPQTL